MARWCSTRWQWHLHGRADQRSDRRVSASWRPEPPMLVISSAIRCRTVAAAAPEVTVAALDTDFFVQFSGVAEPGSGTGANNLFTTQGAAGAFNPVTTSEFRQSRTVHSGHCHRSWCRAPLQAWAATPSRGARSSTSTSMQRIRPARWAGFRRTSSTSMFIVLDGIGGSEDMIVVLKLFDTVTGNLRPRRSWFRTPTSSPATPTLAGTPYEGYRCLDNNDGIVVIRGQRLSGRQYQPGDRRGADCGIGRRHHRHRDQFQRCAW